MADVGKIAVALVSNPAGFSEGMKKAEQSIGSFVTNAQQSFGSLQSLNLSGALGGATNLMGSFAGAASLAANPLTLFAGAAAFAARGLQSMYAAGESSIRGTARQAAILGTTTEAMSGLRLAARLAGGDVEEMGHAFRHLSRHISDAASGSHEAERMFTQIGLSGRELAALPFEEQFGAVLDALRRLPTASDRTAASFRLLGRSGQEALRMVSGGSEGIQRAIADAQRLRISVSTADAAAVQQAVRAGRRLGAVAESVPQSFQQATAAAFAPGVAEFRNAASEAIFGLQPALDIMRDGIRNLGGMFSQFVPVVTGLVRGLGAQVNDLAALLNRLGKIGLPGGSTIGEQLPGMLAQQAQNMIPGLGLLSLGGRTSAPPAAHAAQQEREQGRSLAAARLQEEVDKVNTAFSRTAVTAGMTATQVQLFTLEMAGASRWQLAVTGAFGAMADAATALAASATAGVAAVQQFRTPAERFEETFGNLSAAFATGRINAATFEQSVLRAEASMMGSGEPRFAGAALEGSREAYSAEVRQQYGGAQGSAETLARIREILTINQQQEQQQQSVIVGLLQDLLRVFTG